MVESKRLDVVHAILCFCMPADHFDGHELLRSFSHKLAGNIGEVLGVFVPSIPYHLSSVHHCLKILKVEVHQCSAM